MYRYYNEDGDILGHAWSEMVCSKAQDGQEHTPHVHSPLYAFYGPYICEGFPKVLMYHTADRSPVN